MLVDKIKAHNELNGFWFSAAEFVLLALFILPFAVYYFMHSRTVAGVVASGIVANALTIAAFAARGLMLRQEQIGILKLFNKERRAAIAERYPHLTIDTLVLSVAILIPFIVLLGSFVDIAAHRRED